MKAAVLIFALVLGLAGSAGAAPVVIADKDLAATLEAHVKAVQARDLPALEATITTGAALDLIFPNGRRTTTRKAYVDFHREWFKAANWTWTLEPVAVIVAGDMAIVTARTRYEEREGADVTVGENWLSLAFRKEAGKWMLVYDQNTRVAAQK